MLALTAARPAALTQVGCYASHSDTRREEWNQQRQQRSTTALFARIRLLWNTVVDEVCVTFVPDHDDSARLLGRAIEARRTLLAIRRECGE
jgi:hypothetical protein